MAFEVVNFSEKLSIWGEILPFLNLMQSTREKGAFQRLFLIAKMLKTPFLVNRKLFTYILHEFIKSFILVTMVSTPNLNNIRQLSWMTQYYYTGYHCNLHSEFSSRSTPKTKTLRLIKESAFTELWLQEFFVVVCL